MATGSERLELQEGLDAFDKAAKDSGDSGELLIVELHNLEDATVSLESSFQGAGAQAFRNFINRVNECQGQVIEALSLINVGQGELYKAYSVQEQTELDDARAKEQGAELSW
ncbi:hypothetical protein ACFFIO_11455 [Citricoccus parietis]|uniref:Uncharacterized protein n=1 Tax=Citricoccus parietis TaxID=592307 RepID=A0ABV6F6F7_9MICC